MSTNANLHSQEENTTYNIEMGVKMCMASDENPSK